MSLISCSKKEFKPLVPGLSLSVKNSSSQFCEPTVTDIKATTFYIFVVDTSGSQDKNDHSGFLRFTPIFDFIRNYQGTEEDKYSLILFADEGELKIPLVNHNQFESNVTSMWEQKTWQDEGFSNMAAALNMARMTLEQFALQHRFDEIKPYASVQIVVLSDGYPKISSGQKIPQDDLLNIIKGQSGNGGLIGIPNEASLAPFYKNIKVHTAYYWGNYLGGGSPIPVDPANRELMKKMAEAGNGRFLEFADGQMVDFSQFQQIEAKLRKQLISYYIVPEGMLWVSDDKKKGLVADSDLDGLADYKEVELGSDPNKYDTDGDGINDGIQYRVTQHPCRDISCEPVSRLDPLCQSYLKIDNTIRDSDGDGLNDCEEFYLQSNKENVDSNRNFIPDYDEFLIGNNLSQTNLLTGDTDGDGISDFVEFRKFLPIHIPNSSLTTNTKMGMEYELVKTTPLEDGRQCYQLKVTNVPLNAAKLTFRLVLAFQNPFMTNSTYFYQARGSIGMINSITQKDIKQMLPVP